MLHSVFVIILVQYKLYQQQPKNAFILGSFFSTAESSQLCYTNRCGVVVIGVVVVGSVVNFLNFDLTIGCLPLI